MRKDYCPVGGFPCQSLCDEPCSTLPKKKWVGLTHSEQIDCRRHDPMETARVVEAKLKEKNDASKN